MSAWLIGGLAVYFLVAVSIYHKSTSWRRKQKNARPDEPLDRWARAIVAASWPVVFSLFILAAVFDFIRNK